ncbi:palmitoyltransferase [Coemansia sp. IMI 203386]|nr:palmitoyltransferase [Coemansia sp. IMI 203386]
MKVFHLAVIRVSAGAPTEESASTSFILSSASDLSSFSFFQRGSVAEFMNFFSATVAGRMDENQRKEITTNEQGEHKVHAFRPRGQLCVTVLTDSEYPSRVAFGLASKILDDFTKLFARHQYIDTNEMLTLPSLNHYIVSYQDPKQEDNIMKLQQELDQTTAVMRSTIEQLMDRGGKLNDLVDKSNYLSTSSRTFLKSAKKANSCCIVM